MICHHFKLGCQELLFVWGVLYIIVTIKIGINFTGKHGVRFHGICNHLHMIKDIPKGERYNQQMWKRIHQLKVGWVMVIPIFYPLETMTMTSSTSWFSEGAFGN